MALPSVGNSAPAFTLSNQAGTAVSLSDFKGRYVVLYFYPKALTPGCTVQACGLRDEKSSLEGLNAVALGLSPDPEAKLQRFTDKHDLNFDLLADEGRKVADKYGVWALKKFMGKEYMGIVRTTFIIGPDGRLAAVLNKFKTKTHHEDVLSWLKSDQGV